MTAPPAPLVEDLLAGAPRAVLEGILDAAPDCILVCDEDGRILHTNRHARALVFGAHAHPEGALLFDLVRPEDHDALRARLRVALSEDAGTRSTTAPFEAQGLREEGDHVPVEMTLAPLRLGPRPLVTVNFRDVSARRAIEEELRRSNQELEQFSYVASHDLQEPLRVVINACQLLERRTKGKLDERTATYVELASDASVRMKALVDGLLDYSRVRTMPRPREQVDLDALLDGVLKDLDVMVRESGVRIERGPLPTITGADPLRMRQLMQNLVSNAVKFRGRDDPFVRVLAERRPREWLVSVEDNGIGVPPEARERIFVMFQRLHTREEYPGSGIGLALCRKIVEHHGGRLWIESDGRAGSRFCFTHPITSQQRGHP